MADNKYNLFNLASPAYTTTWDGQSVANNAASAAPVSWLPQNASYLPKSTDNIPTAASVNPAYKDQTNGALGKYQTAMQTLNAISTGIEAGMIASNAFAQAKALKAQARTNLQQMDLNYASYRTQNNYIAEENLSRVSQIIEQGRVMEGEQMAAMGASGFDVSAGEQRILKDTAYKTAKDVDALNRTAYLQSFELWRATMLENTRLKAEADMLKVQAKYTKRAGVIGGVSRLVSGALGGLTMAYSGQYAKNITVGGKQE